MRKSFIKKMRTVMRQKFTNTPDLVALTSDFSSVTYTSRPVNFNFLILWGFDFFQLTQSIRYSASSGGSGTIACRTNISSSLFKVSLVDYIHCPGYHYDAYHTSGHRQSVCFFYDSFMRSIVFYNSDNVNAPAQEVGNTAYSSSDRYHRSNLIGRNHV